MSTWEKFADAKGHIHGKVIAVLVTIALVFSFTNIYVWDEAFGTDDEAATQEVAADETGAQDGIVEPDAESGSDGAIVPADKPAADEPATGGEPADGDSSEGAAAADDKSDADAANEADKPAADEPDATDEVAMPKVTLTAVAEDGATVKVNAPQGALPEGTTISVTKVSSKKIKQAAEAALPEDQVLESYAAYDVKLFDASGNEIEPEKNVTITITGTGISKSDSTIMHMNQAGTAVVDSSEGNSMSTASFSIYIVAEGGVQDEEGEAVYFTTYKFVNEDGSEAAPTQKVTNGDKLAEPSVTAPAGKYFVGWFNGETEFTGFGTVSGVDANSTVTLTAKFADAKYVFFYNADGTQIMHTEVVTDSKAHDFSSVTYDIDSTHSVSGWAATKGGTENIASEISVPADETSVNVYAIVTSGHWISFDSDGGSIVNSMFVPDDQTVALPSDPIKVGYKFQGWFNGDTQIKTGDTLSDSITVVAHWTPATVNYTVNYWKQKVTDNVNAADADKTYDFETSVTKTAKAGAVVSAVNDKSYTGFVFNSANSSKDVEIAGDGTTIINVFYDRVTCTVYFCGNTTDDPKWTNCKSRATKVIQGLFGAPLKDGEWDASANGWRAPDGSGAILLATYDFEEAGYDQRADSTTGGYYTYFYKRTGLEYTLYYYNEQADGTYKLVQSVLTSGNTTINNKFSGYHVTRNWNTKISWNKYFNPKNNPTVADGYFDNLGKSVTAGSTKADYENKQTIVVNDLDTYTLSYYNYNGVSKTVENIKYTSPLTNYASYVPARPSGLTDDYKFGGWYADKACTVPFDFAKETMPNANLQVYAKWAQEPVGIKYSYYISHDDATATEVEVPAGTLISTVLPSVSDDGDWKFVGWVDANGNPIDLETYKVTSSVQLKGKWVYTKELSVQYKNGSNVIDGADTNKY